jgi:protein tyrosine/serine phosphatase
VAELPVSRFALGALCLAGAAWLATAATFQEAPCANFGRVGPGLYRGAEPGERCLGHLAGLGIRMVVNLRDEEEASDHEQSEAVALGMRYVNLPMSGFERPSVAEVQRVLAVIRTSENQPVFVHCKRGRDRTGVIVAAYRMTQEGWTAERAVQEAERFGLAWWQFGMKGFIREFGTNMSSGGGRRGDR